MNLDLNLGSVAHPSQDDQPQTLNLEDWLLGSMREGVSNHAVAMQRLPHVWRHIPAPVEAGNTHLGSTGSTTASDSDEWPPQLLKTNEGADKNGDEGSFFDCNICLDLASEPVVTCCGHLFCWPCLYRWLFVHSDAKECPICKGEVTTKTITPIYTRGKHTLVTKVQDSKSSVKIPSRPQANRIESWRQSFERNALNLPVIQMVRRLDNRFDVTRDTNSGNSRETGGTHLLNRIFTSRGIRRARATEPATSPDVNVGLPNQADANHTINSLTSTESFVDLYFRDHPDESNEEELQLIDRHSMSSVAAIIQSTDSRASGSTTSRRRCESSTSGVSDVDSGNSGYTRRRLQ